MRLGGLIILLALLAGCRVTPAPRVEPAPGEMFLPVTMRIHPIFTGIRDWTGNTQLDGVEVLLEFSDQFGDPTKARGQVIFELFEYRPHQPDVRGRRMVNPWIAAVRTEREQRQYWDRTSRTYRFQLGWPEAPPGRQFVLTAIFDRAEGGRFFSQVILDPVE
jgi:hypothetical protein